MNSFLEAINTFHFLRPAWLLLVIPALLLAWQVHNRNKAAGNWSKVIAPELLPWLLHGEGHWKSRSGLWLAIWLLGSIAMAGPTWQKIPLPVHKAETPLVILFDLSPSMLATDLVPNRLSRSRLKLMDLLNQRQEGLTALIAYGGEAFVVSPLTDDSHTIESMVPALSPAIIPSMGSNVEQAVGMALQLLENTAHRKADLLLITDEVTPSAADAVYTKLRAKPDIRLSILGVGTEQGSPIPLGNGGFAKDQRGNMVMPRLESGPLRSLAGNHGGRYCDLTANNDDLDYLLAGFLHHDDVSQTLSERTTDTWHDLGYLLVLPLLPLLLSLFRRGVVASLALPVMLTLLPSPQANALQWRDLWLTPDQQGARELENGNSEQAQKTFEDAQWKATAAYRNGDFKTADALFADQENAQGHYNRGNALARQGKLKEAIEAYQLVLDVNPESEDAAFNKNLLEELLKNQQNQDSSDNQSGNNQQQDQQSEQKGQSSDQQDNQSSQNSPDGESQPQPQQQESSSEHHQNSSQHDDSEQQADQGNQPQDEDADKTQQKNSPASEGGDQKDTSKEPAQIADIPETDPLSDEEQQEMEQWLRKVPDDPGGLLRKKFYYQSQQRAMNQSGQFFPPDSLSSNKEQRW